MIANINIEFTRVGYDLFITNHFNTDTNEEDGIKIKIIQKIFLIVLGFLALGAIGGGIVLIISPTGELIGIPLSEFNNIPFNNYLIPGIILISVLGVIPLLLIIALLKKPESKIAEQINIFKDMHRPCTYSIYIAFTLIGCVHIQLIFLQGIVHWLHTFYMFYAMLIIYLLLTGLIIRERHQKRGKWVFPLALGLFIFVHSILIFQIQIGPWQVFAEWFADLPLT